MVDITWCPGCQNFLVLRAVQDFVKDSGKKKEDFAIATGIGCHGKMFDYLDLPGINTLHGRVIPTCMGMKLAKPELNVLGFSGDGDAYAEGMEHLIHAARYNPDITYIVHNNSVFALTLGQQTPVSSPDYFDKTSSAKVGFKPLNPIRLMLASGASFVARVNADMGLMKEVLNESVKHKGFSFVEIIMPCLIFNNWAVGGASGSGGAKFYNLQETGHDKGDVKAAMEKAEEFDYSSMDKEIPLGIFFQKEVKSG